jgi:asparagine synthase (glutamine-hydrolysing)
MCGIAGIFGLADAELGQKMQAALSHRGPDGRGVFLDQANRLTLVHTRLAILDPTPAADQPFHSSDGRYVLVYNGEVYNHVALRRRLERCGYTFSTRSDTEVVLAAFIEWGMDCLQHLQGMFAFALVDRRPDTGSVRLYLVRDRLGIKPLLYTREGTQFWFSSELKAIIAAGVTRSLAPVALLDYFAWGAVRQPRTFLQGVMAVPAGCYLEVEQGRVNCRRYWDLPQAGQSQRERLSQMTDPEIEACFQEHLEEAVDSHLVSDVPVGVFLSGGMDSAVIAALAARKNARMQTFCVGFSDSDERQKARRTAQALGTDHHEVVVRNSDGCEIFEEVVQALDQPSGDGVNTWLASRLAAKGVKVVLSGLGADELLNGYKAHSLIGLGGGLFPRGCRPLLGPLGWYRRKFAYQHWLYRLSLVLETPAGRLTALRRFMSDRDLLESPEPEFLRQIPRRDWRELWPGAELLQELSYSELSGYMLDTLLRDADAVSMSHSLELRPPFLHHPLVEFSVALPARFRIRYPMVTKWLLRRLAVRLVPGYRPDRKKRGFNLPLQEWMATPALQERLAGLIESPGARGLFNKSYRQSLRSALRSGRPPAELWAWGVLLAWMESHHLE